VTATALGDREDAFGHLLLDHLAGRSGAPLLERDDGHSGPALGAEWFFLPYPDWPSEEQEVFDAAWGRVLDIGCGAGRHSLAAQERGLPVVAVDISPGAVRVSRARGVADVRLLPVAELDELRGTFDTVLMMCGNFGLPGSAEAVAATLRRLAAMTSAGARLLLDSVDPYAGADAGDLAYQEANRACGRMAGQVTIRIRYEPRVTPWFDLLLVSPDELSALAEHNGWSVARLVRGEPPDFYAVLDKR
jgi:SAM-dependent methyltransferase